VEKSYLTPIIIPFYRRASVLVFVLIVVSSLTIIAISLAYRTRIEIKLAHASSERTKTYYLALAGLERCRALLTQQELTAESTARMCWFSTTSDKEKLFEGLKTQPDQRLLLVYGIKDELSYLDLNKSDSATWENSGCISRQQRASILDWTDPDSDTNPDGAETDFYEYLEPPYVCKNAPFICLKELMFVKDITYDNYLGSILNEESNREIKSFEDIQYLFNSIITDSSSLVNLFTVYGDGKVNINTVSGEILSALPGLEQESVNTILLYRSGSDGRSGTDDDVCIENAGVILQIEGLTELQAELLQQYCCFTSDTFRVFSYSKIENYSCFLMATVKITDNKPQILTLERLL